MQTSHIVFSQAIPDGVRVVIRLGRPGEYRTPAVAGQHIENRAAGRGSWLAFLGSARQAGSTPTQFRGTTRQETTVATETTAKTTSHQRAVNELKELAIIFVYLYITLGAVIVMKTAVLHDQGITFAPRGVAAVKSLLLANSYCSAVP